MKKNMKKAFASLLAATMVMSMSVTAWADNEIDPANLDAPVTTESSYVQNGNPKFSKTYKLTNDNTENPAETFTFTFSNATVTGNSDLDNSDAPEIDSVTTTFAKEAATVDGTVNKDIEIALKDIQWPGVGVYVYDVNETPGTTAGVSYDATTAKLKVTVAYDENAGTYYAAFVTLNLVDEDEDGITDLKIAGFTNEYSAGSLAIKKTVYGDNEDKQKYFDVTVTFSAPDGETVMSDIYYTADEDGKYSGTSSVAVEADQDDQTEGVQGWTEEQTVTIHLKDTDTITFTNIPYGVTYNVKEADYTGDGYKAAKYALNLDSTANVAQNTTAMANGLSDSIDKETYNDKVDIVNVKDVPVDTGILLDSAPYVLLLAIAGVGAFAVATKKREEEF